MRKQGHAESSGSVASFSCDTPIQTRHSTFPIATLHFPFAALAMLEANSHGWKSMASSTNDLMSRACAVGLGYPASAYLAIKSAAANQAS